MSFDLGNYNEVKDRIKQFREKHPEGSLQPANPDEPFRVVEIGNRTFVTFCAAAYRSPDDPRPGIGTAWEPVPGGTPYTKDSELMNAETSAWGRAIVAALAADASKAIASREEVQNRQQTRPAPQHGDEGEPWGYEPPVAAPAPRQSTGGKPASEKQQKAVYAIAKKNNLPVPDTNTMSFEEASAFIQKHGTAA